MENGRVRASIAETILACLALEPGRDLELATVASWVRLRGHPYATTGTVLKAIHILCRAEILYLVNPGQGDRGGRKLGRVGLTGRALALLEDSGADALLAQTRHQNGAASA